MTNDKLKKLGSLWLVALLVTSTFSMFLVPTAAAAAGNTGVQLNDGETYWVGQELQRDSGVNADEVLEVRTDKGTLVTQVQANSNGVVNITTSDFSSGKYKLEDSDNNVIANFSLATQSLKASVTDATLTNGNTKSSNTTLNLDSNRVGYDAVVSVEGLTVNETASLLSAAVKKNVDDDSQKEVVLESVSSGAEFDLNTTDIAAGAYTLNFDVRDTPANASVDIEVSDENPAEATVSEGAYTEQVGDVVTFTVNLENTKKAEIEIGNQDEVAYTLNATVKDGNDDGKVTVHWNTYKATTASTLSVENGDDSVTITDQNAPYISGEGSLEAATYDLNLFAGPNKERTDVSLIKVEERSTDSGTTSVVPGATDDNLKAIKNASTQQQKVSMSDRVVLEYKASGLFGYIDDSTTLTKSGNSLGVYVTVNETNPEMNTQPDQLDVSKGKTYVDAENNTVYVVLDVSDYGNLKAGDKFNATLHVDGDENPYVKSGEMETASTNFEVVEKKLRFYESSNSNSLLEKNSDKSVKVVSSANSAIRGKTTLAPGTEFTVTVSSSDDVAFLYKQKVTVQPDGTFAATYDFSGVPTNTNFTIEIPKHNIKQKGTFVAPMTASITAQDQEVTAGEGASVSAQATLSRGGFLVLQTQDGQRLGVSDYLQPGASSTVTFDVSDLKNSQQLVVKAYEDADGNSKLSSGDVAYDTQTDFALSVTQPKTTTPTPTEEPNTTTEEPNTTTEEPNTTTEEPNTTTETNTTQEPTTTKTPGQPGFGVIVALIALVGAALVAARRRE